MVVQAVLAAASITMTVLDGYAGSGVIGSSMTGFTVTAAPPAQVNTSPTMYQGKFLSERAESPEVPWNYRAVVICLAASATSSLTGLIVALLASDDFLLRSNRVANCDRRGTLGRELAVVS